MRVGTPRYVIDFLVVICLRSTLRRLEWRACLRSLFRALLFIGLLVRLAGVAFDLNIRGEVKYLWTDAGDWWEITIAIDWR